MNPVTLFTDAIEPGLEGGFKLADLTFPAGSDSAGQSSASHFCITRPSRTPGCLDIIRYDLTGRGRSGEIAGVPSITHPAMLKLANNADGRWGLTHGSHTTRQFRNRLAQMLSKRNLQTVASAMVFRSRQSDMHFSFDDALDYAARLFPVRSDAEFFSQYPSFESVESEAWRVLRNLLQNSNPPLVIPQVFVVYAMFVGESDAGHRMNTALIQTGIPEKFDFQGMLGDLFGEAP